MSATDLLLCDDDELELAALRPLAESAGFDVVDTARNVVELLRIVEIHHPQAVVIRNEVDGLSGLEVTGELTEREPRVEVILLTSDTAVEARGAEAGAFAVVRRGDVDGLERALGALSEWLGGGERRRGPDRRGGDDRRQGQDWSKVFSERRNGDDRRQVQRREADRNDEPVPPVARFVPRTV